MSEIRKKTSTKDMDDRDLMTRSGRGDAGAFAALVQKYQKMLLNYFMRMGAYREDAEDLVQETFVRVYKYRRKYKPLAKFSTFIFTLARHARADSLRKAGREPAIGAEPVPEDRIGEVEFQGSMDRTMDLETAMDALSDKLRETVVLTVFQGLSYSEAAEILEVPVGTVKSRMFLAVRRLREVLRGSRDES
jgi:RNA polymerase sigma-70 factor (ECF subfamily)